MTNKTTLHHDDQVAFARKIDASYRQIQSMMFTLEKQIEEQLMQYEYDNAIKSDLNRLSDVSSSCVCDLSNGLHDAALDALQTHDEENDSDYHDYLPDSLNDPDRGTYGEWR